MYFKNLKLQNFRNYKDLNIEFDSKLNIITGSNAQGKTNLIEALFIMGLGKSFRTNNDQEMIAFDSNYSKAISTVIDNDKISNIEIEYKKEGKIIKVDGVKLSKVADLIENVYVVVFTPDDLRIIKEGPESRRKYIDRELCQIKPIYFSDLGNYKKLLKQRNFLLKEKNLDYKLLEVFDESLATYGLRIIEARYDFIEKLSKISKKIHSNISGNKENLEIKYESLIKRNFTKEEYKKFLKDNLEKDIFRGYTSFGPHKDDLCIKVNDIDMRSFGSQGQQRTSALSLKLAEIDLIKEETGKDAVLLLDDVLSELDLERQNFLISSVSDVQVFITTTEIDEKLKEGFSNGKFFKIDNGRVEIYNY